MKYLGLIGFPIEHSYSKIFFTNFFENNNIKNYTYNLFPIKTISEIKNLLQNNPEIVGFNVTSPYKKTIIPYLDKLSPEAQKIQAVNVVKIKKIKQKNFLIGYNTDIYGINKLLSDINVSSKNTVLILGNGCTSKSLQFVLTEKNIPYKVVTRTIESENQLTYNKITKNIISESDIIINTTILGMYPQIENFPLIPYNYIDKKHICIDLIYNPEMTLFLKKSKEKSAKIINGMSIFETQAIFSWEIWKSY